MKIKLHSVFVDDQRHRLPIAISILLVFSTIFLVVLQRSHMLSPSKTLRFGEIKENCVPPNNDQEKKLVHVAIGLAAFYDKYNTWFIDKWKCATGQTVTIEQSRGASGDQMRKILKGELYPDIITMSNPAEIDTIAEQTGIVSSSWRSYFPYNSSPYYSAVVFLVRKGNPKKIKDWGDLITPNLTILVSNPKSCGGGRWVYTGVLGFGKTTAFLSQFYSNVPIVYADQVIAGKAFLSQHIGDVLVTYEKIALKEIKKNKTVEIILPSRTVAMDVPIAIAIKNTDQNNTTDIAKAYVNGLYDPEVQKLIAKDFFRPRLMTASGNPPNQFPTLTFYTREDVFGNDNEMEKKHLKDKGIYDSLKQR